MNVSITIGGEEALAELMQRIASMDAAIQALTDAVAENTTVTASAAALIQGLADRLGEAAGDEQAVLELADEIRGAATALAAAVTENTPAEGEGEEPPLEEETPPEQPVP